MRQISRIALLIIIAVVLAGVMRGVLSPEGILLKSETRISISEFEKLSPMPLIVDARSFEDYEAAHMSNALHLSLDDWEAGIDEMLAAWEPGQVIVVYCGKASCSDSHEVAVKLRKEYQVEKTYHLDGGWEAWQTHAQ